MRCVCVCGKIQAKKKISAIRVLLRIETVALCSLESLAEMIGSFGIILTGSSAQSALPHTQPIRR